MNIFYLNRVLRYLNANFKNISNGDQTIWYIKDKIVALWDNGDLEIVFDILKEGVLKP